MPTSRPLRSLLLALCLSSAACGNPEGGGAGPAGSAPSARSAAPAASSVAASAPTVEKLPGFDLKATLAGQPVDFRNAIAFQRPGNAAVEVIVSTHARDCDTAKKNGIALAKGEEMFRFIILEALSPDGKPAWKIVETYFNGNTGLGTNTAVTVEPGDAARPFKISMESLSLNAAGGEKKLEVQGAVVAKSCGVIPEPGGSQNAPPARAQTDLTLEVAGQKIALQGALYREDQKELVLATIPMSCDNSPFSQGDVALILSGEGKSVNLQGRRIGMQYGDSPKPPLKLKVGKPANGAVEIGLDSDFKVGDWPVKLKGKASALVCAK